MSSPQPAAAGQAEAFPIDALPEELLQRVLGMLPFDERRTVMPLVGKKWAHALRGPSHAWADLSLEVRDTDGGSFEVWGAPSRAVMAWLRERRPMLASFTMICEDPGDSDNAAVDRFLSSLMACTQTDSISSFEWTGGLSGGMLQLLPTLEQLTRLDIDLPYEPYGPYDQAAASNVHHELLRTLSRLSKLRDLALTGGQLRADVPPPHFGLTALTRLSVHGASGVAAGIAQLTQLRELLLLGCTMPSFPAAVLELRQLHGLGLSWSDGASGTLALPPEISRLAQLTSLELYVGSVLEGAQGSLDLAAVSSLQSLAGLAISGFRLAALPADGAWPGGLARLSIWGCGLHAVPPFVSTLTALRDLDLLWNAVTAIPPWITALQDLDAIVLDGERMPGGLGAPAVFSLPAQLSKLRALSHLGLSGPRDALDALDIVFDDGASARVEVERGTYDPEEEGEGVDGELPATACPVRWRPALRGVMGFLRGTLHSQERGGCYEYEVVYDYE